jgi:hypothetical protein
VDDKQDDRANEEGLRELRFDRLEFEREYREAVDESERAQRGLDEVVLEFLFRGDVVRVAVGERAWTGKVVHAGAEVMTLETAAAGVGVDVAYNGISGIRVVERSRRGGQALAGPHPGSIIARLRELAQTGEPVEIGGTRLLPPLEGSVVVVASSHIEFRGRDGAEWIVPLTEIAYVVRQPAGDASRS